MHLAKSFMLLSLGLLIKRQLVLAGQGGFVTLVNATPYTWKLASIHQYQMDWKFPSVLPAGSSHEQNIKYLFNHGDDAAEVTYTLLDSPSPASFTIQARQNNKRIQIQYHDTLSSLNNPVDSLINLGFVYDGAVSFVLCGNGTDSPFISTNPPVAWMQSTLGAIGSKPIREITIPASHDAGMSEITGFLGGVAHNTQTQSMHIYQQLVNGARYFDIRPVYRRGTFFTGHFSKVLGKERGCLGRSIQNIVSDINRFTAENRGELIILDISHDMNMDINYGEFTPQVWLKLYEVLRGINCLWVPPNANLPEDLSSLPFSTFITPGSESAVLIRIPDRARLPDPGVALRALSAHGEEADTTENTDEIEVAEGLAALSTIDVSEDSSTSNTTIWSEQSSAGASLSSDLSELINIIPKAPKLNPFSAAPQNNLIYTTAFVPESRLRITGSYSNAGSPSELSKDQLSKLFSFRPTPQAIAFRSTWTITQRWQHVLDVGTRKTSIIADAIPAHRALFGKLWPALSKTTYPNIIEVDNFANSQVTALVMAINHFFAAPSRPRSSTTHERAVVKHPYATSSPRSAGSIIVDPQTQTPTSVSTATTVSKRNWLDAFACLLYRWCEIRNIDVLGLHHFGEHPPPKFIETDCIEWDILYMPQYCWDLMTADEKRDYGFYLEKEKEIDRKKEEKEEKKKRKKAEKKGKGRTERGGERNGVDKSRDNTK